MPGGLPLNGLMQGAPFSNPLMMIQMALLAQQIK
jgi:hypothetical protein